MEWVLALALVGCGGSDDDGVQRCDAPDQVEYDCEPVANGAPGCVGGPRDWPSGVAVDPDKTFPVGCRAKLTSCSTYTHALEVSCFGNTPPNWTTPAL